MSIEPDVAVTAAELAHPDRRRGVSRFAPLRKPVGILAATSIVVRSGYFLSYEPFFFDELRRIAPQLRMQGLSVTFKRNRESPLITLTQTYARIVSSHVNPNGLRGCVLSSHAPKSIVTRKSNACKAVTM